MALIRVRSEEAAMELLHWLLQSDGSMARLILRITLAVVIFPYRAQKVLGWFGGHGFSGL